MRNWKKKPVTVQAVLWNGINTDEVIEFTGQQCAVVNEELVIVTLEDGENSTAKHVATVGDYIIRGVQGEFYPCKPDIFMMTYERVNGPQTDYELEDVRQFYKKFDIINNDKPVMLTARKLKERIECMQEELNEFAAAVESGDFAEQADALIDLVYFAKGTGVMMGLPWKPLWDDVQRANMGKVRGVGKRGHSVDMIKPEGWQPPKGALILEACGYNPEDFMTDGVIDQSKCIDDASTVSLLDEVATLISAANDVPRGDNMTGPVGIFDSNGTAIPMTTTVEIVTPPVTAQTFIVPLKNVEDKNLEAFRTIIPTGTIFHMLDAELRHLPFIGAVGDKIKMQNPETFELDDVVLTQEMVEERESTVMVRVGFQQVADTITPLEI